MRTLEDIRAILDALPRPIGLSQIVEIGSLDPETGRYRQDLDTHCFATSPRDALFMLQYMQDSRDA